jgi:hypothetical protein
VTDAPGAPRWRGAFSLTLLLSATLLFAVQPMIARMLLPLVGGAAAVWSTCLFFFQATLVGGYLYAHVSTRHLSIGAQVLVHGSLLACAALVLPIAAASLGAPPPTANPLPWLLRSLCLTVGLPFLGLAATTPLVQTWFARAVPTANAYSLYAAANFGSFLGLLAYPLVVEPALDVDEQSRVWAAGFAVTAALIFGCGVAAWRKGGALPAPRPALAGPAPFGARVRWVVLASLPAALTISVTTYISTDIAGIPLVWVFPLSLYLLTFVIAFARSSTGRLLRVVVPIAILPPIAGMLADSTRPAWLHVPSHLIAFFAVSLACHQALARSRPVHARLSEFYLWLALGGATGGIFAAILAPVIFRAPIEYPIGLLLAAYAGIRREAPARGFARVDLLAPALSAALVVAMATLARNLDWPPSALTTHALTFAPGLLVATLFWAKPRAFVLALAVMFTVGGVATGVARQIVVVVRSFYGVHRIQLDDSRRFHVLLNGSTIHGLQPIDPARRRECLGYYSGFGPAGQVFESMARRAEWAEGPQIAVLGLGAGTLACYARPGQRWTFYEIDPAVAKLASGPDYFTYLADAPAPVDIVLGDARLSLARSAPQPYNLIVVDVFSSDAIPVHLLTREALRVYLDHLAPGGLILVHVSNLYLDLRPVVGAIAGDAGLTAYANSHDVGSTAAAEGVLPSEWVVLARDLSDLGNLATDPQWSAVPAGGSRVWTDQHASLVSVLKFRR